MRERGEQRKESSGRVRWVLSAPFASRRARLRAVWHYIGRGYEYEICMTCGRPVGRATGSWWGAPDDLWRRVSGDANGVLCPLCFTAAADALGEPIHWEAVPGV